jgi:2-keto-4-pentenoate hydratase
VTHPNIETAAEVAARAAALKIAQTFVGARQSATPLPEFPGAIPPDMASGYAVQEQAIGLWPDSIAGWKVGLVPPPEQARLGTVRLSGPIFRRNVLRVGSGPIHLAAIAGGFAAIEVELVAIAGADARPDKTQWTLEEAAALVGAWHLGVEFAASPFAGINDLGATVVIADFGNNSGLVVGSRLDSALLADPAKLVCRATIETKEVGWASAAALPGGPLEALRFLLGHLAGRGRPLRAGQWVSTGAVTGVHRIFPGQKATAELIGRERIEVSITTATAAA